MEKPVYDALADAAQKSGIIDPDLLHVTEFRDTIAAITVTKDGVPDKAAIEAAVAKMKARKPAFFVANDWAAMDDATFREREAKFRAGLRKSRPMPHLPASGTVNYALMSADDFAKADAFIRGRTNDASVFARVNHKHQGDQQ
jgi:hypothetical protein